jgi:hypothetical protein
MLGQQSLPKNGKAAQTAAGPNIRENFATLCSITTFACLNNRDDHKRATPGYLVAASRPAPAHAVQLNVPFAYALSTSP